MLPIPVLYAGEARYLVRRGLPHLKLSPGTFANKVKDFSGCNLAMLSPAMMMRVGICSR